MGNLKKDLVQFNQKASTLLLVSMILASCVPSVTKNVRGRTASTSNSIAVNVTQGKILADNPIILSGNPSLAATTDLSRYMTTAYITNHTFLQSHGNCSGLTYCFEVREKRESVSALQTADGKWGYVPKSEEFLQVNTFYHLGRMFDFYFANLSSTKTEAYDGFSFPIYDTAIPLTLYNIDGTLNLHSQSLVAYSNCDVADNSTYDQATEALCFGHSGSAKQIRWAHDSTIIYHETGHFLQRLQLNFRNAASLVKTQMGNYLTNEAGALGEGLSDFASYYINARTHWGEWAAGYLGGARPMSEGEAVHAPGLAENEDQRLSYPEYITYDPNAPEAPVEDIHVSGMIVSHYLVALTKDLQSKCSMSSRASREFVMTLLNETLSELGDLTSKGTVNGVVGKVNLNATYSSTWFSTVNPINYRSFSQTMAKNLLNTIGNAGLNRCNGTYYQRDYIEGLLDSYGLLLFKTYNQYRNMTNGTTYVNTAVNPTNRKKSVLIAKSNIILDPSTGASSAYVIDNRSQIQNGVTSLQSTGIVGTLSAQTPSDFGFNNNNSKVSPGEVVAIALNLYNNSNSTMGGVQILANDWDHADTTVGATYGRPCRFSSTLSNDLWPLESEGGSVAANCGTIAASAADFAPVCFIQTNESSATKWVSQKEFKTKISLDSNSCLDKTSDKDCFIRAVKGADKASYGKINPKSTWGQTMANPSSGAAYGLDWGNVILFEVSKHIPPGTVVDCRLRVRFTNCEDCYHDASSSNKDFFDYEYNGPKPFKVIHLQIPITD